MDHKANPVRPSRRGLLGATAWSVPAIAVTQAAPAFAASQAVIDMALTAELPVATLETGETGIITHTITNVSNAPTRGLIQVHIFRGDPDLVSGVINPSDLPHGWSVDLGQSDERLYTLVSSQVLNPGESVQIPMEVTPIFDGETSQLFQSMIVSGSGGDSVNSNNVAQVRLFIVPSTGLEEVSVSCEPLSPEGDIRTTDSGMVMDQSATSILPGWESCRQANPKLAGLTLKSIRVTVRADAGPGETSSYDSSSEVGFRQVGSISVIPGVTEDRERFLDRNEMGLGIVRIPYIQKALYRETDVPSSLHLEYRNDLPVTLWNYVSGPAGSGHLPPSWSPPSLNGSVSVTYTFGKP